MGDGAYLVLILINSLLPMMKVPAASPGAKSDGKRRPLSALRDGDEKEAGSSRSPAPSPLPLP
ncbi:hypothetical protein GCWU000341_00809 [Oribacterium sp. oral taxon 078 str. F0262]|nr:hypothetical protein GCWU000341_00809 [Oribacterium sp. oral taxon 078 str. F0262]